MRVPGFLLRHTVTVERFLGDGPTGPTFGPEDAVRCFVEDGVRLVRDREGREVVSTARVYTTPDVAEVPAESRVAVAGRTTHVIAAHLRDGGGLPAPSHRELVLA